ncbi:hypothetical protein DFH06DRAFT_1473023 [Mycena polygramma]|nr:hypothetical protein DFH06DRAFT_1473023 [Mycena polygramma]
MQEVRTSPPTDFNVPSSPTRNGESEDVQWTVLVCYTLSPLSPSLRCRMKHPSELQLTILGTAVSTPAFASVPAICPTCHPRPSRRVLLEIRDSASHIIRPSRLREHLPRLPLLFTTESNVYLLVWGPAYTVYRTPYRAIKLAVLGAAPTDSFPRRCLRRPLCASAGTALVLRRGGRLPALSRSQLIAFPELRAIRALCPPRRLDRACAAPESVCLPSPSSKGAWMCPHVLPFRPRSLAPASVVLHAVEARGAALYGARLFGSHDTVVICAARFGSRCCDCTFKAPFRISPASASGNDRAMSMPRDKYIRDAFLHTPAALPYACVFRAYPSTQIDPDEVADKEGAAYPYHTISSHSSCLMLPFRAVLLRDARDCSFVLAPACFRYAPALSPSRRGAT